MDIQLNWIRLNRRKKTTTVVTFSFSCFIIYTVMWFYNDVMYMLSLCVIYRLFYTKMFKWWLLVWGGRRVHSNSFNGLYLRHCVNYDDGESFNLFPDQFFQLLSTPGAIKLKRSIYLYLIFQVVEDCSASFVFFSSPLNRNKSNWQARATFYFSNYFSIQSRYLNTYNIVCYIHCVCFN